MFQSDMVLKFFHGIESIGALFTSMGFHIVLSFKVSNHNVLIGEGFVTNIALFRVRMVSKLLSRDNRDGFSFFFVEIFFLK